MKNCSRVPVANGETKFLGDRVPCREAEYFYQVPIRRYHGSTDVEPKGRLGSRAPPKVTVDVARDDLWTPTAVRRQRWPSMSPTTTSGRLPCRALTVGPECPRGLRAQLYAGHMSAVLEDAYSNARRYEGERRLYATGRVTADAQSFSAFPPLSFFAERIANGCENKDHWPLPPTGKSMQKT